MVASVCVLSYRTWRYGSCISLYILQGYERSWQRLSSASLVSNMEIPMEISHGDIAVASDYTVFYKTRRYLRRYHGSISRLYILQDWEIW